jgi:hypothetical protein
MKRRALGFLILTILAIFVLIAVLIILMTRPARAADLPEGVSCEQVRAPHRRARQGQSFSLGLRARGFNPPDLHHPARLQSVTIPII